ncbi:MAG: hypothetical protein WAM82_28275 [Thermoanaerobaculia bacterium]
MKTQDLERIRFTARHFNDLQGLRYGVPLGLVTLGWGGAMPLRIALSLGALLLTLGARRYYRAFGEVEAQPVHTAAELAVFAPAGAMPRVDGFRQVTPMMRHFFVTMTLALIVFSIVQAIPRSFQVEGHESLWHHPRITSQTFLERPWIVGSQPQPTGLFQPPWVAWVYAPVPARPPSMLRAVFAQTLYVVYGSFFLGFWLWRGRGHSEHHLALAALLLGLASLGTALGYVARTDGEIGRVFDLFLPALVYPGVALLLCGFAMILAGLFDHWQLVAAMRPAGPQVED